MTDKVKRLLNNLQSREYKKTRRVIEGLDFSTLNDSVEEHLKSIEKAINTETPVFFEDDSFGFNRSAVINGFPWGSGNVTPDWNKAITRGFDEIIEEIRESIERNPDHDKKEYGKAMIKSLELCFPLCEKYKTLAKENGNEKLYNALCKVPHKKADTFYEACVFIKLCIFFMRLNSLSHIGFGRFDQYMYPYYLNDKKNGVTDEEFLEIIEEFFISINRDSDLYDGVQQGDNGQSMVLGGFDKDGNDMYNELSKLCMQASLELSLIDPKINLRVNKSTPDERYEFGTLLTKQGLGFPQYCNDDVVIPGLLKLGFDPEDAYDYTVAACWEFIIPGKGAEVPNYKTMNFPLVVNRAIVNNILRCKKFENLMGYVEDEIKKEIEVLIEESHRYFKAPRPLLSVFTDDCISNLTDMWYGGAKYKNFGCHGAGIANAADALAAVKEHIYDKKDISKDNLLKALENNFEGYEEMRNLLKASPKMGNNDDYVDDIACSIMGYFANNLNNRKNHIGGIWRAGTGSAQDYILKSRICPATADGRKDFEPYASSFSPSLDVKPSGLLSVLQSFTKFDMTNIINGGPLTIEIHDSVLRNDIGIKKTAQLVKAYIKLGGHQLQLNSINRDTLLDAQKHPEKYPNLIVRVWGWSGYFNELDLPYQNHIIRRLEYLN